MRYFLIGLEQDIWLQNLNKYWEEFNKISNKLPKRLVNKFSSIHLHDSEIEYITYVRDYSKTKISYNVIVKIRNEEFSGSFIHYGVTEYWIKTENFDKYINLSEYLYGELLNNQDSWTHNFIFSESNEVFIRCKKIDWNDDSD